MSTSGSPIASVRLLPFNAPYSTVSILTNPVINCTADVNTFSIAATGLARLVFPGVLESGTARTNLSAFDFLTFQWIIMGKHDPSGRLKPTVLKLSSSTYSGRP